MSGHFVCIDCGEVFTSLPPPAETREDDSKPRCNSCIENMMDQIDSHSLSEIEVERIMSKVVLR